MTDDDKNEPSITSAEELNAHRMFSPMQHLVAITDPGRVRDHNEDTFFVADDGRIMIVADGMGGHAAGEVASALAVETVRVSLERVLSSEQPLSKEDIDRLIIRSLQDAHHTVLEAARARLAYRGMGTALIVAYLNGNELYTCHVGDVRCYVKSGKAFDPITEDHSVVGSLVREGHLSREAARIHPERSIVLQAIGGSYGTKPDVNHRVLNSGDLVLLCSDGLWESMPEKNLGEILAGDGSIQQRAERLVECAIEADGSDNITAVLYEHRKRSIS